MEKRVKQLSISADEMDKRQSAVRRLNRNENNRLRQQHDQFRDSHEVIAVEIDQKMKKIQNELHGIRKISGYEAYARTRDSARYHENNGKRKKKQRKATMQRRSKDIIETRSRKRTALGETQVADSKEKLDENSSLMLMGSGDNLSRHLDTGHTNAPKSQTTVSTHRVTRATFRNKAEKLPQLVANATSDSRSLLELDVSEARTQARKRILGENEMKVENTNEESQAASADDVESYMYVPPDGRKRTVYLVPPLEDLLKEARKARYLRMPKRQDDDEDPEKELSVDEIFS